MYRQKEKERGGGGTNEIKILKEKVIIVFLISIEFSKFPFDQ